MEKTSKWIKFVETADTGKTKKYDIVAKQDGITIGEIKWYGPWRCYSFFPERNCVFERQCLTDITAFITALMELRKK